MDANKHVAWCLRQIAVLNPEGETWAYATAALNALGEGTEAAQTEYSVVLKMNPDLKIDAMKAVRQYTHCGLREAKDAIEGPVGTVIAKHVSRASADALVAEILKAGGSALVQKV